MNTKTHAGTSAGSGLNGERELVRDLARQVAEIASEPRMAAIMKRWRDVNALRKPDRAPVWCKPVGCWKEILPPDSFACEDPWLRGVECDFRQTLCKRDIDDDTPVDPWFSVPAVFDVSPSNLWGVDVRRHRPGERDGAWAYDPPLKIESNFDKLVVPAFTYNEAKTREAVTRMEDLLGDILPVKLVCGAPLSSIMGARAADLRGLTQMMLDMIDAPELMHRLMGYLRDAVLDAMDQAEATGLVSPNNSGAMTCSEPVGPEPGDGRYSFGNCWCMANSQEFDQVSPAMWQEFCLDYQRPIIERFGMASYGCCEDLTHKIDGVLSIPNLRIFTSSAWTDLAKVQSKVGTDYCIMWRQKASAVVFPDDESAIRRDLIEGARQLQGSYYQVVLRELQTLGGHPDRLHVWARLAREAAEKYA